MGGRKGLEELCGREGMGGGWKRVTCKGRELWEQVPFPLVILQVNVKFIDEDKKHF